MPRVYSYVVAHDFGFSPNPFHGWCTLACCKPAVRRTAQVGDLVVGMSSRCTSVVYVLRVEEKLSLDDYWRDPRFRKKRPKWEAKAIIRRCGDNIYEPDGVGGFRQLRSSHWDHEHGREDLASKRRDTSGPVLAGNEFVYFGGSGPALPGKLSFLAVTRGHRSRFTAAQRARVQESFDKLPRGVCGRPGRWPDHDRSWKTSCASS